MKTKKPNQNRGRRAAVLPPMPLSFEEALSGYLQVNPDDLEKPKRARKAPRRKPAPKRKAAKQR